MAVKLGKVAGEATQILPFNRGHDSAPGNPPGQAGSYPLSYLWQRVLHKDAWLRIFQRFVLLERRTVQDAQGHTHTHEALIFPRFHHWEGVNAIVQAVRAERAGQPYLVEHSAGSGKTHIIAWTARTDQRERVGSRFRPRAFRWRDVGADGNDTSRTETNT